MAVTLQKQARSGSGVPASSCNLVAAAGLASLEAGAARCNWQHRPVSVTAEKSRPELLQRSCNLPASFWYVQLCIQCGLVMLWLHPGDTHDEIPQ